MSLNPAQGGSVRRGRLPSKNFLPYRLLTQTIYCAVKKSYSSVV